MIATLPLIFHVHHDVKVIIVRHEPLCEIMEIFLWALENGQRDLVKRIFMWGKSLEGNIDNLSSFKHVQSFFDILEKNNELDSYYKKAGSCIYSDRVFFTGYLGHEELCYLYPCCDIAIFPSIVKEAGSLVFLEAIASGCFPMGTYFGGMAANIDSISKKLSNSDDVELMKISAKKNVPVRIIKKTIKEITTCNYQFLLMSDINNNYSQNDNQSY